VLNGGAGKDRLSGFAGKDAFVFDTPLNAANNVDVITDFSAPSDTIRVQNTIFSGLAAGTLVAAAFHVGASAAAADDRIVYNKKTGALLFDFDGSGSGAAVQFATLTTKPAISNLDFFVV
jgi:serralysin